MYDVMIIDDEKTIRDRLKSNIEWEELGIRCVCEASDSDTARELFLLNRPKIIITDIHIPIISGLDLASEIISIDPDVRFIVITGYNDFEYVKNSVKIGAIDLISKPIRPKDINTSLKKAVDFFEKIKNEQRSSQELKSLLKESLPILQEKYIQYLLNQAMEDNENEIRQKLKSLCLDITADYYTVALISPSINSLSTNDSDSELVIVKSVSEAMLRDSGYKLYSFYDNNYCLNCLLSWNHTNDTNTIEETISNIHDKIYFYWGIKIYSGIGMLITDIAKLHDSRREAFTALNYQGVLGNGPVINYKNIIRLDNPLPASSKKKIITYAVMLLKNNQLDRLEALMRQEIYNILSTTKDYIKPLRKLIFDFMTSIINESIELGVSFDIIAKYFDMYEKIFSSENVQFFIQYLLVFAKDISKEIFTKRNETKNHLISLAKNFILSNLDNEKLNLDLVSNNIGLSSIYFSKLFNKEENISFTEYLNIERVKKAKSLLKTSSLKVYEISYECGFGNPKYFNYVFKKIAGVTPLEYRNSTVI